MDKINYYDSNIYKAKILRLEDNNVSYIYIATDDISKALNIAQDYCKEEDSGIYTFDCICIKNLNYNSVLIETK